MSNVSNAARIADTTLVALKADAVLATKTGVAEVNKPNSYDKTAVLIVKKSGLIGGVKNLIDNNTKIDAGVSSFDNKWLPKGETWIINAISIAGSDDTSATVKPANATFSNLKVEASIQSAKFQVVQGKTLLDVPVRRLVNSGVSSSNEDNLKPLTKGITLLPETPFNFTIEAASDATPVADGYLMLMMDVTVISTNDARQSC